MKKTILVAAMLLSGVALNSAVYAAPDFGAGGPSIASTLMPVTDNSRELAMAATVPGIPPVPVNDTTPAAGHFTLAPKAHIRLQSVAEFSNVRRPAFLTRVGFVKLPADPEIAALEHHDGPGAAIRPLQRQATARATEAECRGLDRRLDKAHLRRMSEQAELKSAGCGSEGRASI